METASAAISCAAGPVDGRARQQWPDAIDGDGAPQIGLRAEAVREAVESVALALGRGPEEAAREAGEAEAAVRESVSDMVAGWRPPRDPGKARRLVAALEDLRRKAEEAGI